MEENNDKLVNRNYMQSLEEALQKGIDEDLIEKMAEGRERIEKERKEEMKQKEIAEERRRAEEEKKILEEGMKILEEREKEEELRKKSDKVEIAYSSKFDAFLIRNVDLKKNYRVERKAMPPITPLELAEKMNEPEEKFKNIDRSTMMHLQLLCEYDERYKTNKANQYLEEQQSERATEERVRYMRDIFSIGVHYDLTALYENGQLTKGEQEEILDVANASQEKGMATVKKGMKVYMKETINKVKGFFSKIKSKTKTLKLPLAQREEGQREDKKDVQESGRTAEQKIKTIDLIIEDRKSDKREVEDLGYLKQDEIDKKNNRGLTTAEQQKKKVRNLVEEDRILDGITSRRQENGQQYIIEGKEPSRVEQQKDRVRKALQADRGELQRYILNGKADGKLEENARKTLEEKQQGAEQETEQGDVAK